MKHEYFRPLSFPTLQKLQLKNENGIWTTVGPKRSTLMSHFVSLEWHKNTSGSDVAESSLNPLVVLDRKLQDQSSYFSSEF